MLAGLQPSSIVLLTLRLSSLISAGLSKLTSPLPFLCARRRSSDLGHRPALSPLRPPLTDLLASQRLA